ncbi:hypothetical protein Srufu_022480 [Streptomyces libani subsp. rufus]|nr:hypothetical protein Srufu_022480 [Streptomyces libani subsp. rufus]
MLLRALGDHLDAAVTQIDGKSREFADAKGVGPGEPAEPDALDLTTHPGGHSDSFIHVCTLTGQLLSGHICLLGHGVQSPGSEAHSYG